MRASRARSGLLGCGLLLSVALPHAAIARDQAARPTPRTERITLSGHIRNISTSQPVADATLTLAPAQPDVPTRTTKSGPDGRYQFDDVRPGRYRVLAERHGFIRQAAGGRPLGQSGIVYSLSAGEQVDVDIELTPYSVIAGRTVSPSGEPLPHLPVQLLQYRYFMGQRRLMPVGGMPSAVTNDLGEYRIANVAAGRYFILVAPKGLAPQASAASAATRADRNNKSRVQKGLSQAYYPSGADPAAAIPIDVPAGAELPGIDVVLQEDPVFHVRGRLQHASAAESVRGAMLTLVRVDGEQPSLLPTSMNVVSSGDGVFDIPGVASGRYVLVAQRPAAPAEIGLVALDVIDQDVDFVELVLGGGVDVRVTAMRQARDPEALTGGGPLAMRVEMRPLANPLLVFGMTPTAQGGVIRDLVPGAYAMRIQNVPSGHYLKSAIYGAADVLEGELQVGQRPNDLTLVFQEGGGGIDVSVTDPKKTPLAGALVTAVPVEEGRRINLSKVTTTDQRGLARLDALAPGQYFLLAWEDIDPRAVESPAFLQAFRSRAQRITVADGAVASATLSVISGADVDKATK
jgi:hypothetical protein